MHGVIVVPTRIIVDRDDGFVAMIPSEKAAGGKALGSKWSALGWSALALASLGWITYQLCFAV